MKKFIICLFLSIFAVTGYAEVKREGDTFKVEKTATTSSDTQTKYTWQDKEGNKYPIFITKKKGYLLCQEDIKEDREGV